MELDYKAVLRVQGAFGRSVLDETSSTIYGWLRRKRLEADRLAPGLIRFTDDTIGTLARLDQRDGTKIERFRLTEVKPGTDGSPLTWVTEILTYQRQDGSADVLIHVADPRSQGVEHNPNPTAVPGIARDFLNTTDASDGCMTLRDEPKVLDRDDEDLVHEMIVDESRRGLLVLAPAPVGVPIDSFKTSVKSWTKGMAGQAGVFVLSSNLTELLQGRTGYLHLPVGGMRAVPPGTDPALRSAASTSYFITASRLAERESKRVERHWTWMAREQANALPWPKHLQRINRTMTEHERLTLLQEVDRFITERNQDVRRPTATSINFAPTSAVTTRELPDEVDGGESKLESVDTVRAKDVVEPGPDGDLVTVPQQPLLPTDDDELARALVRALPNADIVQTIMQIGGCTTLPESLQFALLLAGDYDQLQDKVSNLTSEMIRGNSEVDLERILVLEDQLRELQSDNEELQSQLDRETRGAQYLRGELTKLGRPELAWATQQEPDLVQDFDQLLEVVNHLTYVLFTGDSEKALALDEMRSAQATARKAHRALLALNDYGRAKAEGLFVSGGFMEYLNDHPVGFVSISAKAFAPSESETVQSRPEFRRLREFRMPSGEIRFMQAHIRLSQEGTTSPRVYFEDDTAHSGSVIVGYIGPHLLNTRSN